MSGHYVAAKHLRNANLFHRHVLQLLPRLVESLNGGRAVLVHACDQKWGDELHGVVVDGLGVRRREKEDVENELLGRGDGLLTTADQGGDAATLRQNTATNRVKRLLVLLLVVGLCF